MTDNSMEEINKMTKIAFEALEDKKAENPKIIHIGEVSAIADYFIIANGTNQPQITAMVEIGRASCRERVSSPV